MEIQINDYSVDFELDGEKTISDVIYSITEWTQKRDLIFTEAKINNENYAVDQVPEISLDEVKILNCIVQSKADVIISSFNAAIDYCSRVQTFIEKSVPDKMPDMGELDNIASGIGWLSEVLNKSEQLLSLDFKEVMFKDKTVQYYLDGLKSFSGELNLNDRTSHISELLEKGKDLFLTTSDIFKMLLMSDEMKVLVIQSIDSPDILINALVNIKKEIPNQIENLEQISISYQTGKDEAASQKLTYFVDFIFQYTRTCYQLSPVFGIDMEKVLVDGISITKKNNEIQVLLKEITSVMENKDIISLSDILEYEMKPALENAENYIDLLIDLIKKDK